MYRQIAAGALLWLVSIISINAVGVCAHSCVKTELHRVRDNNNVLHEIGQCSYLLSTQLTTSHQGHPSGTVWVITVRESLN